MSIIKDGKTIDILKFNSTTIDIGKYNSTQVYSAATPIDKPTISGTYTYNGSSLTVKLNSTTGITIVSGNTGTNAGTYTLKCKPSDKYTWKDGSTSEYSINWTINKLSIEIPTLSNASKTYNKASLSPTSNHNTTYVNISGNTGTNAGTYTVTWSLKNTTNTLWKDGTIANKTASWSIAVLQLTIPSVSGGGTYKGSQYTATVSNYNSNYMTLSGLVSGTNAGTYTVTWTLSSTTNTKWSDGTTSNKAASWYINRLANVTIPSGGTYTWNGSAKSLTVPTNSTASNNSRTIVGTTLVTFSVNSNYAWTDGTTANKTANIVINPYKTSKPTLNTTSIAWYGSSVGPTPNSGEGTYWTTGGNTSYNGVSSNLLYYFYIKDNYKNSDGTYNVVFSDTGNNITYVGWSTYAGPISFIVNFFKYNDSGYCIWSCGYGFGTTYGKTFNDIVGLSGSGTWVNRDGNYIGSTAQISATGNFNNAYEPSVTNGVLIKITSGQYGLGYNTGYIVNFSSTGGTSDRPFSDFVAANSAIVSGKTYSAGSSEY